MWFHRGPIGNRIVSNKLAFQINRRSRSRCIDTDARPQTFAEKYAIWSAHAPLAQTRELVLDFAEPEFGGTTPSVNLVCLGRLLPIG